MSLTATRLQVEEREEKRRKLLSALLTSFLVALLLVLLIFFGFKYLDPPPPEEGVEVSMGQEFGGFTQETPQQTATQKAASAPKTEDSYETQDFVDAPEEKNTPSQNNPTPTQSNEETKDPEPNKTVNSNWQFEKGNKNTNNGDDNTDGNKGKKDGDGTDPLGNKGLGDQGKGWYLSGRKKVKSISADCKFDRAETVVLKIEVDKNGYVKTARCIIKYKDLKSTKIGDPYCKCAVNSMKNAGQIFSADQTAKGLQTGYIKYDFKVK